MTCSSVCGRRNVYVSGCRMVSCGRHAHSRRALEERQEKRRLLRGEQAGVHGAEDEDCLDTGDEVLRSADSVRLRYKEMKRGGSPCCGHPRQDRRPGSR